MAQNTPPQDTRVNIRVNSDLKKKVELIFEKMGLNLSDGINIYLHRVAADKAIPFSLAVTREQLLGEEAIGMEDAFTEAVKAAIARKREQDLPVARFDMDTNKPYLEYPDGRREYSFE